MPVIRVDDAVWERLKSHARPLEDTPNSVLRRLLGIAERGDQAKARAAAARAGGSDLAGAERGTASRRSGQSTARGVRTNSGRSLNAEWRVGAKHALYHKDGTYYNHLNEFPGALFDANGYVLFATEAEYKNSAHLQHGVQLHVPHGIASLPGYVRVR